MTSSSPAVTAIRLHHDDDVVCLLRQHEKGEKPCTNPTLDLVLVDAVPLGHKVAVRDLAAGAVVKKYGQAIGHTKVAIAAGEHVHLHNLRGLLTSGE